MQLGRVGESISEEGAEATNHMLEDDELGHLWPHENAGGRNTKKEVAVLRLVLFLQWIVPG